MAQTIAQQFIHSIQARPTQDGDGVRIQRIAGQHLNATLDPFLLIDEIRSDTASDYIGGFPEHPHRGFETITYMKAGRMRHKDHLGNEGVIGPGDAQWMTAGRGVLHSEIPEQDSGLLHGFQLWLNLPAREKMQPAAYRTIHSDTISSAVLGNGSAVRALGGRVDLLPGISLTGPITTASTQPLLLDIDLPPQETLRLQLHHSHPTRVYTYAGSTDVQPEHHLGIYTAGNELTLSASHTGVSLLVLGGQAIGEPIAQYGPFVMNTLKEIDQAMMDYQQGVLV